jgi:hypothetical protein
MTPDVVQAYNVEKLSTEQFQNPDNADTLSGTLLSLDHPTWPLARGIFCILYDIQCGGRFKSVLSKQLQIHVKSDYSRILTVVQ